MSGGSEQAGGVQAPWTVERLAAFAHLDTPVWVYDFKRDRFFWGNEPMLRLFAASSLDALRERYAREPMSEGMRRRLRAFQDRFARSEEVREPWTFYPEGHPPVHADTTMSGIRAEDEGGVFEAMLIEARVRASPLLSKAEQRLVVATQHANECVALYDTGGLPLVRNPAAEALRTEGRDRLDALFVDAADAGRLRQATSDPTQVFRQEAVLHTREGPRWHAIEARRIHDPVTGKPALLLMHHDVSDRRASEARLVEARAEAEALSAQAQAASEAKSRFVAVMSHELRTPMTALLASAELLGGSPLDEAQREALDTVFQAGDQMVALIGDVLDVSAMEAGRIELAPEPTETRPLLRRILGPLKAAAERKGLTLTLDVAAEVPAAVRVDRRRLGQVLGNLVGNAIKFTDVGRVAVGVEAEPGERLAISVADQGPGVPEECAAQLFEPFERGDVSVSRRFDGVGLGLFIARSLVELMGGEIAVASTPGRGATFRVTLDAPTARLSSSPAPRPERQQLGLRLLLADDNRLSRRAVARLLRTLGCEVVEAEDGAEALEVAARRAFDVVLLDVEMPRMDGPTAAIELRRSAGKRPIVALTADVFFGASEEARVFDAIEYKPVDLPKLTSVLERLGGGSARDA
ncbi:MAG: ATP-binding protein [Myxococcota bacterium]